MKSEEVFFEQKGTWKVKAHPEFVWYVSETCNWVAWMKPSVMWFSA